MGDLAVTLWKLSTRGLKFDLWDSVNCHCPRWPVNPSTGLERCRVMRSWPAAEKLEQIKSVFSAGSKKIHMNHTIVQVNNLTATNQAAARESVRSLFSGTPFPLGHRSQRCCGDGWRRILTPTHWGRLRRIVRTPKLSVHSPRSPLLQDRETNLHW